MPPAPVTGDGFTLVEPGGFGGLDNGETENSTALVFFERGPVTLSTGLWVEEYPLDQWLPADDHNALFLPAGTSLCSWFVHFDAIGNTGSVDVELVFDSPVIGIAPRASDLWNTAAFEHPAVAYGPYDGLGNTDAFRQGAFSVELDLATSSRDQIRVLTAC